MKKGTRKTLEQRLLDTVYKGDASAFHKPKPPTLTAEDWAEIWSALESKSMQLRNGDYGETDEDCDVDAWADHLDRIVDKIGEDGCHMVADRSDRT